MSEHEPEEFALRISWRSEQAEIWLKHYERILLVLDRFRVGASQIIDEEGFPAQMRCETLSVLSELFAYKQVILERVQGLTYLIDGKTENDPAPDPKKMGSHLKFVKSLMELIRSIEGELLPDFRASPTFQEHYQPRISPIKSDDSFWLWKAERKAYSMRKHDVLPRIREARAILTTQEENITKFEDMVKALKEDPDLCDV
jgi:hypothetical protein